jgi:hypothetical protein
LPQKMILPHEELSMRQMMREMRFNLDNEFYVPSGPRWCCPSLS